MGEFELIARYFTRPLQPSQQTTTILGIGDDCALLAPRPDRQLAVSSDMLVAGRHFFDDVDPRTLGHKALAVNLSDLAACGAQPLAFTLALALPHTSETWLAAFSDGLLALADDHGCTLIGGDTTRGPLATICITVLGEVPPGAALLRSGARAEDDIYVSGTLGDAHLALLALQGKLALPPELLAQSRRRLEQPTPRVALGLALRGIASAAADISDGLVGDLGHILQASGVGARIDTPVAMQLIASCAQSTSMAGGFGASISEQMRLQCVLAGGDDYELVFTAPVAQRARVQAAALSSATPVTRIGQIEALPGLRLRNAQGNTEMNTLAAFDHFETGTVPCLQPKSTN